jgi:hypothetical protein
MCGATSQSGTSPDERGAEIDDADLLETLCRSVIAPGSGEAGPAHQIAYQQCPDCRRVTQNGSGRELDVGPEVFERAACDAKLLGSLDAETPERATTTVTPRIREQVFARDHHRCVAPGCRSARNLRSPSGSMPRRARRCSHSGSPRSCERSTQRRGAKARTDRSAPDTTRQVPAGTSTQATRVASKRCDLTQAGRRGVPAGTSASPGCAKSASSG